eukprot:403367272
MRTISSSAVFIATLATLAFVAIIPSQAEAKELTPYCGAKLMMIRSCQNDDECSYSDEYCDESEKYCKTDLTLYLDNPCIQTQDSTQESSSHQTPKPSSMPTGDHHSHKPSGSPTPRPSRQHTPKPSRSPTSRPSKKPSGSPTSKPSKNPSGRPTRTPSQRPTGNPTRYPTGRPSGYPTRSGQPTRRPTKYPTGNPSRYPTHSQRPTKYPTRRPTSYPTHRPTYYPTPSFRPTSYPTYSHQHTTHSPSFYLAQAQVNQRMALFRSLSSNQNNNGGSNSYNRPLPTINKCLFMKCANGFKCSENRCVKQ